MIGLNNRKKKENKRFEKTFCGTGEMSFFRIKKNEKGITCEKKKKKDFFEHT